MRKSGAGVSITVVNADIEAIRKILLEWGKAHYKEYAWRMPDQLWHGLIAEILLQRTRANNVVPVYETFIRHFPAPENLAGASVEDIEAIIYPLGLRWRAPLLKKLGESLVQTHGEVPRTYEKLLELPGVGPYVASAWLVFHGGGRSVIIDANVVRWLCRLVDQPMNGETRRKKWLIALAEKMTPAENNKAYNFAALDFTMEVCALTPKCEQCPLGQTYCLYRFKNVSGLREVPL